MGLLNSIGKMAISGGRTTLMHDLAAVYKPAVNRNKDKLIEIVKENVGAASTMEIVRKLQGFKGFYVLEMAPPSTMEEMKKLMADLEFAKNFFKSGSFKFLTIKEIWLLFLVGLEISLWFYIGETIGKFHFVGYKV